MIETLELSSQAYCSPNIESSKRAIILPEREQSTLYEWINNNYLSIIAALHCVDATSAYAEQWRSDSFGLVDEQRQFYMNLERQVIHKSDAISSKQAYCYIRTLLYKY